MTPIRRLACVPLILLALTVTDTACGQLFRSPHAGAVYRDYTKTIGNGTSEWRVTDPNASFPGTPGNAPGTFLPNPTLDLTIGDLTGAVRAEAVIDLWGGHVGTTAKQMRFNGGSWITIPELSSTPSAGECYTQQLNVTVDVPLADLTTGTNILEGTSGGQTCYNFNWGQWGWYMVTLRVYYDGAKPRPSGMITSHSAGDTLDDFPTITASATGSAGISRVEFFAYYDGYDTDGDGTYQQYHHAYHRTRTETTAVTRRHVGTVTSAPFEVTWNTDLVPDQAPGSVKLIARIRDNNGIWFVTDEVPSLTLHRVGTSVKLYKPQGVPEKHWVRNGETKSSTVTIPATDVLADAQYAKMLVATWNGIDGHSTAPHFTKVNGWTTPTYGQDHFYSFDVIDVPPTELLSHTNTITFHSQSMHHGIEILWPGPALLVRYDTAPDTTAPALSSVSATSSTTVRVAFNEPVTPSSAESVSAYTLDAAGAPVAVTTATLALDGRTVTLATGTLPQGVALTVQVTNVADLAGNLASDQATFQYDELLLAHWDMDDATGNVATDISGGNRHGTVVGASWTTQTGDGSDSALRFASALDAVELGNVRLTGDSATVAAWFQADSFTVADGRVISRANGTAADNHDYMISTVSVGAESRLRARLNTGSTTTLVASSGALQVGSWYHTAMTYDGATMRLYLDGAEVASTPLTGTLQSSPSSSATIGNQPGGIGERPFDGSIDDVRLYGRALTPAEISALVSPGPCTSGCPVPFARGDCDTTSGMNITDVVYLLEFLFTGGPMSTCPDACDVNDDGGLDLTDAASILCALFCVPAQQIPAPGLTCGVDGTPTDLLECSSFPCP